MSEYIHNLPNWDSFWYTNYFNNFYKSVKIDSEELKKSTFKNILMHYLDNINWKNKEDNKKRFLSYIEVFK
jgi:hypothetical protein